MWFVFSLICTICWGCADIFYKKGSSENQQYSHLKIAVWVGLVMGVCSTLLAIVFRKFTDLPTFFGVVASYLPASLGYILSMVIGYAGMRYLEISVISPVQNSSGALSMLGILFWLMLTKNIGNLWEEISLIELIGTALIVFGVIFLGVCENKYIKESDDSHRYGALALIFPILYCVFDTIGTTADGIILDGSSSLNLDEIDVLIVYGYTFLMAGIVAYLYMLIRSKIFYNPFEKGEMPKMTAALCEEAGQFFYVYAFSGRAVIAAPMISSYCIISVILSRIFLKEKLYGGRLVSVCTVIGGIFLLGVAEGLAG